MPGLLHYVYLVCVCACVCVCVCVCVCMWGVCAHGRAQAQAHTPTYALMQATNPHQPAEPQTHSVSSTVAIYIGEANDSL